MSHIHSEPGQIDHTVEVFVVHDKRVLLRKHDKYDIWIGVGGHIELDEDPNQASIREVSEEVGLDIKLWTPRPLAKAGKDIELIPPMFMNIHPVNDTHRHIAYVYFATSTHRDVTPENEHDEWRWLSREEVEQNKIGMDVNIQDYARTALKLVHA